MSTVEISGVQVVVFDLDDTLYMEQSYAFGGFEAVGAWLGARIGGHPDLVERMRQIYETSDRLHVFDELLAELGVPDAEKLLPQMVRCYHSHVPDIQFCPDVPAAFGRWSTRFRMGLITDGPVHVQQRKIDALALSSHLNPIVKTGQWGRAFWKPHPRAYKTVTSATGVPGSACLYIADNAEKDFVSPRRLGWHSVQVRRPGGVYTGVQPPPGGEPDHQVRSLDEIELSS